MINETAKKHNTHVFTPYMYMYMSDGVSGLIVAVTGQFYQLPSSSVRESQVTQLHLQYCMLGNKF